MTRPNGRQAAIDERRTRVARLVLRKHTQREIVNELYEEQLRNPDTGQPYCLATVNRDIAALRKQWRANAAKNMAEAVGDHLAELREVRRAAWKSGELNVVLKSLRQESDIQGINSPTEIKHSGGVQIAASDADLISAAKEVIALTESETSTVDQ